MMRFLHLADVHLDTPFAGRRTEVRRRLRAAVREAFGAAVDTALDEGVDAVVIAGDLFDGDTLSFQTERFLLDELRRLTGVGISVVYATGNHDPGRQQRRSRIEWPEGVHVADGSEPIRVAVHDREGRPTGWISAVGHASDRETRDLSTRFPAPAGMLPEVAVLHAQVGSSRDAESHGRYAPTTVPALRKRGFDYWALGHVHRRQELSDDPAIHYPGNLQGRTPAESGARGGLLVELDGGQPARVVFRSFAPVRWETLDWAGWEDAESLDALIRSTAQRWEDWLETEPGARCEWMLRIRMYGGTPLWRALRDPVERETLETELIGELGVLDVTVDADAVHAPVDPDAHRDRPDALGYALQELERLRSGTADSERFRSALQGWDERTETLNAYLARILSGADADLVSWMREPD
jgi:hypothetical protein